MSDFGHGKYGEVNGHCRVCGGMNGHHFLEDDDFRRDFLGEDDEDDDDDLFADDDDDIFADDDSYSYYNSSSSRSTSTSSYTNRNTSNGFQKYNQYDDPDLPRQKNVFALSYIGMFILAALLTGGGDNISTGSVVVLFIAITIISFIIALRS